MKMFYVGQQVVFCDPRIWGAPGGYIRGHGLQTYTSGHKKVYVVVKTEDYSDGSQRLWVRSKYSHIIRGDFCSLRFKSFGVHETYQYDPSQQGDTEDDI